MAEQQLRHTNSGGAALPRSRDLNPPSGESGFLICVYLCPSVVNPFPSSP
jgi:hypothetical protein